ncbi:MAG: IS30 family transposase [Candidatus Thiodiazotropha sp. (ex Lucinoma aequizonata)]|nr:IS30 family transposase [Candidatus Thiodiazotropha sp. (ex Lucinoma aequizonata)]
MMNVPLLWSLGSVLVTGKATLSWVRVFKSALLRMVERKTLYTVIMRLTGKQSGLLAEAAVAGLKALKSNILTITLDNGLEFADHDIIVQGLDADIYFTHPYCSWERGINENTNGLIRQYFPEVTDFNKVSDEQQACLRSRERFWDIPVHQNRLDL